VRLPWSGAGSRDGAPGARVEVLRADHRDLRGRFDKIVSIEMFEGRLGHYDDYLGAIERLLTPHGVSGDADDHLERPASHDMLVMTRSTTSVLSGGNLASQRATANDGLRFETFLSDLAGRLLDGSPEEVDSAIQCSLVDLASIAAADRAWISSFSEDGRSLRGTHTFAKPGVSEEFSGADLAAALPQWTARLREGHRWVLPRLPQRVPEEATAEWTHLVTIGTKSHFSLPLKAGGEVLGVFSMSHLAEYADWSPLVLARLEMLASVYASALYRRRIETRLQRANELSRSILAAVTSEIVVLDRRGRVRTFNEAWRQSSLRSIVPLEEGSDYLAAGEAALASGVVDGGAYVEVPRAVLAGERALYEGRFSFALAGGARHHYLLTGRPLPTEGGVVLVHTDVTEAETAKADLALSLQRISELEEEFEGENVLRPAEVRRARGFDEIVGTTPVLAHVLDQIQQVATTKAPVLILGETGTGKELVARAIHDNSPRRGRPLVTVNCAALPAGLIESELFGYEPGAFTGALRRTAGRFEAARGGSILLDEIGELPLEAQAKLLRVLDGGGFQRLGSGNTTKVDVRVLASTNRDLHVAMQQGKFRADLYYRLSVFPITLPPLRDRRADVPLLVWHFVTRRQAALGKKIRRVPRRVMNAFLAYSWPGNVRELENVIERALIDTTSSTLAHPRALAPSLPSSAPAGENLADIERAHIRGVLGRCS
jgi:PAS domain-containing protein